MRLMFIGKDADDQGTTRFEEMGRRLGYQAAAQGAEIMVGSDKRSTLDAAVVQGAAEYARVSGLPVPWSIYEPDDRHRFPDVPLGLSTPQRFVLPVTSLRWQYAHLEAVRTADALIAVGGRANTYRACRAASEHGRAVWPLPGFGGASEDVFAALVAHDAPDRSHARDLTMARAVTRVKDAVTIATRWVALALQSAARRARRPRRVYFLSYSRIDAVEADHVELLLRRRNRGVLRDEVDFPPGSPLEESMQQAIATADDVLVLDSENAAKSTSVLREIEIARASVTASPESRRLLGMLLQGMPPRTPLDPGVLHPDGATRDSRQLAIAKVVEFELPRRRAR